MQPMKPALLLTLLLTPGFGCAEPQKTETAPHTSTTNISAPAPGPAEIIAQAESIYQQAKAAQYAWIVTGTQLAIARKALVEGHAEAALTAARRALFTAKASLLQGEKESEVWQNRVPKISE